MQNPVIFWKTSALVSALPWSWYLLFCRVEETATECMKIAALQQNAVLPLGQSWKVTLRPYVVVYLKCKGDNMHPVTSLPEFVSFWGAATRAAHRELPLQEASEWALQTKLCCKETPFSSLLPSSCTRPLLIPLVSYTAAANLISLCWTMPGTS